MRIRSDKTKGRGRRRSLPEMKELVGRLRSSGLSHGQFALEQGVSPGTVANWVRRVGGEEARGNGQAGGGRSENGSGGFVEVKLPRALLSAPESLDQIEAGGGFELIFADDGNGKALGRAQGLVIRGLRIANGYDPGQLQRLLVVLDGHAATTNLNS